MEFNLDGVIPNVNFDSRVKRYRYIDTGQFLSKEAALSITKRFIEREKNNLIGLADRLESGEIDLVQFQIKATEHLKHIHVSQAVLGADGSHHLTSNDFLWIGRNLKKQYYSGIGEDGKRYGIKNLSIEIDNGTVSPARLRQRLAMYADSGQAAYWQMKRTRATDKPYEVRVLNPFAKHCASCLRYAADGPRPIGEHPLPGTFCECLNSCKCNLLQISLEEAIVRGIQI